MREQIDILAYLQSQMAVYELGRAGGAIVNFNCPLCGDHKLRGWVNIVRWTMGCWNSGCDAEERLQGGVIELVRRLEHFSGRGEAWVFLLHEYPANTTLRAASQPTQADVEYSDWCRLPVGMEPFKEQAGVIQAWFTAFAHHQWGIGVQDLQQAQAGYCCQGRYAWRIIFPIVMGGHIVAFQARTIKGAVPKYLSSRRGLKEEAHAECGRPMEACLYNVDAVVPSCTTVIMEGIGDVLRYKADRGNCVPVGILGTALTSEKISLLSARKPQKVIVALDAGADTYHRATEYAHLLSEWGMQVAIGEWVGGKDAGTGACLQILDGGLVDWVARQVMP